MRTMCWWIINLLVKLNDTAATHFTMVIMIMMTMMMMKWWRWGLTIMVNHQPSSETQWHYRTFHHGDYLDDISGAIFWKMTTILWWIFKLLLSLFGPFWPHNSPVKIWSQFMWKVLFPCMPDLYHGMIESLSCHKSSRFNFLKILESSKKNTVHWVHEWKKDIW